MTVKDLLIDKMPFDSLSTDATPCCHCPPDNSHADNKLATTEQMPEERLLLAHGGGGSAMQDLIERYIMPLYSHIEDKNGVSNARQVLNDTMLHDAAVIHPANPNPSTTSTRAVMTTDSYVIQPLFFPGGDIGTLSVIGTVNDLAMAGASPHHLALSLIIQEGLRFSTLEKILNSIRSACLATGLQLSTGDTKVIEQRSPQEEIYITTTGVGYAPTEHLLHPSRITVGDHIILTGDLGRHAVAVMNARLDTDNIKLSITSDCAPLHTVMNTLLCAGQPIHCARDLTRGGLAAALNELATATHHQFQIELEKLPVHPEVAAYCETLGLEPTYLANEGCCILFVPAEAVAETIHLLKTFKQCVHSTVIGKVLAADHAKPPVTQLTGWGIEVPLPTITGEQLPRIC